MPWEPTGGRTSNNHTTLFIDNLPRGIISEWTRDLFSEFGKIVDVFVSKKKRKSNSLAFGFVRFSKLEDARRAVEKLDGHEIKGLKIKVSMARYDKGGSSFKRDVSENTGHKNREPRRRIVKPAFRDKRRYADVVAGDKKQAHVLLKLSENSVMVEKLNLAAIVELEPSTDVNVAASLLTETDIPFVCNSSLSPSKIVVFF